MSELTEAGQVETRSDGTKVFVHGHRYPDNVQVVTQQYDPAGKLVSAKVEWTGFAGKVLDATATFDDSGKLIKEEGYRAPDMTTPIAELLKPLPSASAQPVAKEQPAKEGPVVVPSLAPDQTAPPVPQSPPTQPTSVAPESISSGLHQIYGDHAPHSPKDDTGKTE